MGRELVGVAQSSVEAVLHDERGPARLVHRVQQDACAVRAVPWQAQDARACAAQRGTRLLAGGDRPGAMAAYDPERGLLHRVARAERGDALLEVVGRALYGPGPRQADPAAADRDRERPARPERRERNPGGQRRQRAAGRGEPRVDGVEVPVRDADDPPPGARWQPGAAQRGERGSAERAACRPRRPRRGRGRAVDARGVGHRPDEAGRAGIETLESDRGRRERRERGGQRPRDPCGRHEAVGQQLDLADVGEVEPVDRQRGGVRRPPAVQRRARGGVGVGAIRRREMVVERRPRRERHAVRPPRLEDEVATRAHRLRADRGRPAVEGQLGQRARERTGGRGRCRPAVARLLTPSWALQ